MSFIRWIILYFKGGDIVFPMFFAQRVISGKQSYESVPNSIKPEMDKILIESGLEHLIDKSEK